MWDFENQPWESRCARGRARLLQGTCRLSRLNDTDGIAHLVRVQNVLEPSLRFALLLCLTSRDVVCSAGAACLQVSLLLAFLGI